MFSSVTARARVVALVSAAWLTNGSHNSAFAQDHYCGVYSAYAALDHYGRTVPFDSLLEPAYVSGYQGSTASDVARALVDHGVAAKSFSGLGLFDLRIAGAAIILHVRGHQGTRDYRHWVVFLGEQGGQAVVLDPSRGETRIQYSRLLSLWDGLPGGQSLRSCLKKARTLPVGPENEQATSSASSSASSRPGVSAFHEPMVEYVTVVDSGAIATAAQRGVVPIEKAHAQAIGPVVKTLQQSTEPRPGAFAISLPNPCRAKRKNFFSEFPQNQVDRRGGRGDTKRGFRIPGSAEPSCHR